jgi:class 3 adenylate cyclase/tetratricopeptide (TPR) repeat protein
MNFEDIGDIKGCLNRGGVPIRDLYTLFELRQPVPEATNSAGAAPVGVRQVAWLQNHVSLALDFTTCALEREEFLLVCDVARETFRHWGTHADDAVRTDLMRVRINYATALARLGFPLEAREKLEPYVSDSYRPALKPDLKAAVLRQLGNILRDESQQASTRAGRLQKAHEALAFYKRSLELEPEHLETLALTAAASLFLDGPESDLRGEAYEKARKILQIADTLPDSVRADGQTTRWRAAAHAVLGQVDAALEAYKAMQKAPGVSASDLADARHSAEFLARALGKPRDFFKKAFPPLQLVVFVGHLPDLPDNPARFPNASVEQVRQKIREKVAEMDVRVGFVGAAAGADLLFIEALLERNATVHVVLPWTRDEFLKTSIHPYEPPGAEPIWEPLFNRALKEAATVREIGQAYEPTSDVNWRYLVEVTAGLALQTARISRLDVQPLVLWDGLPGWGIGGTAAFAEFWRDDLGYDLITIELPAPPAPPTGRRGGGMRSSRSELLTMRHEVKSMLFADIVGYSKLHEGVIPKFVETFLSRVSLLVAQSKHAPRSVNTWGDAVYAIFDFARDAGSFALELTEMIQKGKPDWLREGLYWEEHVPGNPEPVKHPLNIRVGLHTGPVFRHYDPVVRQLGFTGAHVSRAARIEPVANPGEVFASEQFAALAELDAELGRPAGANRAEAADLGFVCEYAGTMKLAKGYPGRFRIYRVLPKRVFAVEELARAAHELYCIESHIRGETPATNVAMRPWEELTEDLREANRAQVVDIPNKLRGLGYELSASYGLDPKEIEMSDARVEELAIVEHDRWMKDRRDHGWTYAPTRDNRRKYHPLLVPWEQLNEVEKQKDRDTVRNLPRLIAKAGFTVRKIAEER